MHLLAATADVGMYRVAAQGAFLVPMGLTALNMVTAPYITRLHVQVVRASYRLGGGLRLVPYGLGYWNPG